MISRTRLVLIAVSAVTIASLLWLLPVFAVTGSVKFIDPTDSTKDLTWARQGGQVGLEVTDSDLNVAVKRVLLPVDMTTNAATAATTNGLATFTLSTTTTASATATTSLTTVATGDTVLIGINTNGVMLGTETVRRVLSINMTTGVVTLNKPLNATNAAAGIFKVNVGGIPLASADNCPTCGAAQQVLGTMFSNIGNNIFTLASVPVVDQGGSGTAMSVANRFATANADTAINVNDLYLATAAGAAATGVNMQLVQTSGMVNIGITGATSTFYALYWGSAANDTGATVKVTSQSDPAGITVVLTESGPITGIFRLNIVATSSASDATTNPPQLQVARNDQIKLWYSDASPSATISTTLTVESTSPVFSNLTPAHGAAGQSARPVMGGDVTDADWASRRALLGRSSRSTTTATG
ncbi:MAG: hypothetical protein QF477_01850 [SAR202 cluster bacterium]|nr:hypothetical protein [SAR202 cluster bacterium]